MGNPTEHPIGTTGPAAIRAERVAQMLDLSKAKVFQLLAKGTLPSFMIDGSRRVLVRDVEEYLQRLRDQATAGR